MKRARPYEIIGGGARRVPNIILLDLGQTIDEEALILLLLDLIAASNGSACTSADRRRSKVVTSIETARKKKIGSVLRLSSPALTLELETLLTAVSQIQEQYR